MATPDANFDRQDLKKWVLLEIKRAMGNALGDENYDRVERPAANPETHAARRKLQRELDAALDACNRAERSRNALSQALAVIAHELRAPLNFISICTELIRTREGHPSDDELFRKMRSHVDEARRLIDDPVDAAGAERNVMSTRLQGLRLHEVLHCAAEKIQLEPNSADLCVSLDLGADDDHIRGDERRLMQLFTNLLHNAMKYSLKDATIRIRTFNGVSEDVSDERCIVVEVQDKGVGISTSDIERIFRPFERASATAQSATGLGLGLFIARQIAELHGGTLTASSSGPGQGATFHLTLPLGPED